MPEPIVMTKLDEMAFETYLKLSLDPTMRDSGWEANVGHAYLCVDTFLKNKDKCSKHVGIEKVSEEKDIKLLLCVLGLLKNYLLNKNAPGAADVLSTLEASDEHKVFTDSDFKWLVNKVVDNKVDDDVINLISDTMVNVKVRQIQQEYFGHIKEKED